MQPAFDLTQIPATRRQRAIALVTAAALLALSIVFWPIRQSHVPGSDGFVPMISGALIVAYLVTSALMLRQAVLSRRPSLKILATGFAFIGFIIIPYAVLFPGFLKRSPFPGREEASSWLWVVWHLSLPMVIALYAWRVQREKNRVVRLRYDMLRTLPVALIAAAGLIAICPLLPAFSTAGIWEPLVLGTVRPTLFAALALAVGLLAVRRFRSMLDVFLGVTLFATALEVQSALSGGARFSVGWYTAKIDTFVAMTAVLIALLSTSGRLSGLVSDAERRMRSLVDGVADALIALDDEESVLSFNPAATQLFGYAPSEDSALNVIDVIPDYHERLSAHGTLTSIEALGRNADGRTFPIELAFGEGVDGHERRTIVIARDITQRKRAETAIKAARDQAIASANVKADFLATMSHEIRTPINAVVGTSELLLQSDLGAEAYEYAKTVRDSAESLLGVINDILDFSKIEAGKMELDARPTSLVSIVESAADICAASARAKGLALVTHVAPDVPATVFGDAHRIRQIMINMIGNAVKFTDAGNVIVRAIVDHLEGDFTFVRFSIADTGPGIAVENLDTLFEAFRQVDQSARRRHGGTGLGLTISKRLVEFMGGTLGVDSTVGAGSTFWFTLAFERVEEDERIDGERPVSLRGSRILLVVDDDVSRGIIEQYVMAWGVVATSTTNPAHAVALLRAGDTRKAPYDAVIVDFAMPTVDGFAFAARIRSDPLVAGTPLILVSSNDDVGRSAEAIARGFGAYLRKPLKQSALFDALCAAVRGDLSVLPREAVAQASTRDGILVLVAEDNVVNRKLALQQLKKLGYRAHAVENGAEAIAEVARHEFDVVLMDCQMPEVDGFEATVAIRKAERSTGRHVPIVAMTANALEGDREACLAAGMDDYLAKPVQLAELRAILERFTTGAIGAR